MESTCFRLAQPLQQPSHSHDFARPLSLPCPSFLLSNSRRASTVIANARKDSSKQQTPAVDKGKPAVVKEEKEEEFEEVEVSWIQDKAETLYQNVGTAVNAVPGPRVGSTSLPWLLAVPIGYLGITFVVAVVKTLLKYSSPKAKRRRLVDKNVLVCTSIDEDFTLKRTDFNSEALNLLQKQTGFTTQEILRKYIRYALNEKPFSPDLVANLIYLRKVSKLEDSEIVEILNDVSQRIVKEKGRVLMDTRGMTEKGVKRKAAVQALFSKLLYLSELDEFCQVVSRGSLQLKEIFGVTDDDANSIRIETLSEMGDVESLENMVPSDDVKRDDNQ